MSGSVRSVIPARTRQLGKLEIRRLLPSRECRMVGPFIYFDHIGPENLPPGRGVDVPPHPHINLATITYLFEGDLVHRDSLGTVQMIRPGEINWMHAGRGIVHSERSSPSFRGREATIHGIQLWVALPRNDEETSPKFDHYPGSALPFWQKDGVEVRLLIGEAYGRISPVRTRSRMVYLDVLLESGASLRLPDGYPELCAYVVFGTLTSGEAGEFPATRMVVLEHGEHAGLHAKCPARVLVLGGDSLDGERHVSWNFVSSSRERIERAKDDWRAHRFPAVPGDTGERLELPDADAGSR